jgi:integrase
MDIKGFLKAKAKPLSENTLWNYENSLDLLARTIDGDEPTVNEIIEWLNTYDSVPTLERHKSAIRRYWEWRYPETDSHGIPVKPLVFPRDTFAPQRKKVVKYTDPVKYPLMLEKITDPDDKMFFRTLFTLGCRISELIGDPRRNNSPGIEYKNFTDAGVKVIAKGGDEQEKVCPTEFLNELKAYCLFKDGHIFTKGHSYYLRMVKRLGEAVGEPDMDLHSVRHMRGIDLIDKGADPAYVANFLGHSNLKTVMTYLAVSKRGLQARINKFDEGASRKV